MKFQFISHVHLFQHQLDILFSEFGGTKHSHITPAELEEQGFEILNEKVPVVIGAVSPSLVDELLEAGFTVYGPRRAYPRSVTRPWETRTVLSGYARL